MGAIKAELKKVLDKYQTKNIKLFNDKLFIVEKRGFQAKSISDNPENDIGKSKPFSFSYT